VIGSAWKALLSAAIHADLRAVERFFTDEASTLAKAITATGYVGYPVPQRDRDALFLRYRDLHNAARGAWVKLFVP